MSDSILDDLAAFATSADIALIQNERFMTYAELHARARHLATYLQSLGVTRDVVVGVVLERSAASIVAALAILQARGAYLPIDPAQPRERTLFELRDAAAHAVITQSDSAAFEPPANCRLVTLDVDGRCEAAAAAARRDVRAAEVAVEPGDLAYVIYTSGSSGRPKGVEISHGGLANLVAWHRSTFAISRADRASHVCALGFDAAVWEIWPYLTSGATIAIASQALVGNPPALRDWLLDQRVTIGFVPSPVAERLIELEWPNDTVLRVLLTGADTLHRFAPAELPFALVNNYGPTETTVVATSGPVPVAHDGCDRPSLGRAVTNVEIVIVNENGEPVAAGDAGEIWIGGAGVARGYRNQPALTAERFIEARFERRSPGRFYRTGDRGRIDTGGELVFLGRVDAQMKIRGYRVEPGEIEAALVAHPAICAAAVVACEFGPDADARLIAYVVATSALPVAGVRHFLAQTLPAYMLPARVIVLPELPLTARGKIDRAALRAHGLEPANAKADTSGRTPAQRRLASIIAPLFGLEDVSMDDAVLELGGHSLLLMKLTTQIRDTFGVELSLRVAFDAPTIGALAAEIERLAAQPATAQPAHAPIRRRANVLHR